MDELEGVNLQGAYLGPVKKKSPSANEGEITKTKKTKYYRRSQNSDHFNDDEIDSKIKDEN